MEEYSVARLRGYIDGRFAALTERIEALEAAARQVPVRQEPVQESVSKLYDSVITNSIRIKMNLIPAGTFEMGSPENEKIRDSDEGPIHQVTISKPFYMGICQVTQGQYEKIVGDNPSVFKGTNLPVEWVSWDDAVAFCQKLTEMEQSSGQLRKNYEYRLPTEAEWEYACRAGTTTRFYWGGKIGSAKVNSHIWHTKNSRSKTHPIGRKNPNAFGLHDMCGNVWEWCSDWKGDYPEDPVTDPAGPETGEYRVLRGGSWLDNHILCRSAYRFFDYPDSWYNSYGFRIVLSEKRS